MEKIEIRGSDLRMCLDLGARDCWKKSDDIVRHNDGNDFLDYDQMAILLGRASALIDRDKTYWIVEKDA